MKRIIAILILLSTTACIAGGKSVNGNAALLAIEDSAHGVVCYHLRMDNGALACVKVK